MKKIFIIAAVTLLTQGLAAQTINRSTKPKAGPAPVITFNDPTIFKLANGITVLVVENHKLPKISASYRIDAGPVTEGNKAGVMGIMGGMLNEGTTSKTKAQFDSAVDQLGANVDLGANGGSASALSRYFEPAFLLMAEALKSPSFPQESFEKLKSQTLTGLKSSEKSAKAISERVVNALAYGKTHPYGEFETESSVNALTLNDIKESYKKYITPSRGYLTFVGDIKPETAKALAEKAFGSWKGNALTLPVLAKVNNPTKTEVDVVNVSNAVQSEITLVNLINLPMSNPDYFAVLLANEILGGGSDSRLFKNLREKRAFTYGAYSSTGSDRYQSKFSANAAVRNEKVDSAVVEMLNEVKTLRTVKVSAEELQNAKNLYNGSFALGLENPARTAAFASNILINNLPKDFYRNYLKKLNAVTADDVLRVAKTYFNYDNTRVVVVGKTDQFTDGLKKAGFVVKEFDNYATRNVSTTAATTVASLSTKEIIGKYITAIGGEIEVNKISDFVQTGEMAIQGQKLAIEIKGSRPNLSSVTVSMMGQTAMKDVFNGTTGFKEQMGQKKDYTADEITEKTENKQIFEQLGYANGFKLENAGTAKVGNNTAFKVNITSPSGKKKTDYFDVKTGLLLKDEKTIKEGTTEITQSTEYSDYRKVGNVLFPFTLNQSVQTPMGNQDFSITIKDIKTNTGLKPTDFK